MRRSTKGRRGFKHGLRPLGSQYARPSARIGHGERTSRPSGPVGGRRSYSFPQSGFRADYVDLAKFLDHALRACPNEKECLKTSTPWVQRPS